MINLKSLSTLLALFSLLAINTQAQFYWVGGSGNWSDYENHWATTSGGTTFHTAVPSSADDVIFDENSFPFVDAEVVLDASQANCHDFDCSTVLNYPTFTSSEDLKIYGSASFSGAASYYLFYIEVRFGDVVTSFAPNGAVFEDCLIEFQNTFGNGVVELEGDLSCSIFRLFEGTFNTNGYTLTATSDFYLGGVGEKILNLSDSEIYCDRWRVAADNLTINPGTSNIFLSRMYADEDGNGPFDYYDLTFLDDNGILYNSANFNTINATGTAGHDLEFDDGSTITCNDFILEATRQNDCWMHEGYMGTIDLIVSTGSIDLSFVRMQGIHASGGATFNVNPGVDLGNNSGWNFTDVVPFNYYWVGDGGDWNDLFHWSSTSGGAANYGELSSRYDNVFFDDNSFSGDDQTLVLNYDAIMHDLDFSGLSNELLLTTVGGGDDLLLYGNMHIADQVEKDLNKVYFLGTEPTTIKTGSQGYFSSVILENEIVYDLEGDVNCGHFRATGSTLHTNDYTVTCVNDFKLQNDNLFTHELGSSEIFCRDFEVSNEEANLNSGTATIHVAAEFAGSNHSFYHVIFENEEVDNLIEDNNTFEILEFAPGTNCEIEVGTTQTANEILINGTGTSPISISSDEAGEQATLSKASGTVNATFVSLQDNNATGGATFNALQAVDFGNNTGWNITELQPNDFYWVGGSGNWTDYQNHWATTSGGDVFYSYIPGVIDNVYFDENSFNSTDQVVTIDTENIHCNTMDWTGVINNPHLSGVGRSLNVFGSLIFTNEMTSDLGIYNFLGEGVNSVLPGFENSPGIDSEVNFLSTGVWNIDGDLTTQNLNLASGTVNTNDFYIDVKEDTQFHELGEKTLNLGSSILNTRDFKNGSAWVSNLTINGGNSSIICRRTFVPYSSEGENNSIVLNDLHFELDDNPNKFIEEIALNNLTLDPGVVLRIHNDDTVTVNQLIAGGTADLLIEIKSIFEGMQATISQASGTVDGEYLMLQDIVGSGGAIFTANNSIDNGNVSGWIFTGQAQSIAFSPIDNVIETIGSFDLDATASSGLPIVFNVIDGPATIDGNTITITGAGTVEVEASQVGNDDFNPAAPVEQEFCSNPIQPTISADIQELFVTLTSSSEIGNSWYLNGELFGEYDPSFQTAENGDYTVQVSIDGCLAELSEVYTVLILAIDELVTNEPLITYPNPTKGSFSFTLPSNEKAQISMYNALGKLVYSKTAATTYNGVNNIDISSFDSGIYFLLIETASTNHFGKIYKE